MNKVILIGRLTRDPEIRYTPESMAIARFSIAVDRKYKQDGGQAADFPSIVAFSKTAEFVEKYFFKGMKVAIEGHLQTGSYTDRDGNRHYTTDVIAENVEFAESKKAAGNDETTNDGFMNVPDFMDEELPFN